MIHDTNGNTMEKNNSITTLVTVITALLLLGSANLHAEIVSHHLNVRINPKLHTIKGSDEIRFRHEGRLRLYLSYRSKISSILLNDKPIKFRISNAHKFIEIIPETKETSGLITIEYSASFQDMAESTKGVKHDIAFVTNGVVDKKGTFLPNSSLWYPQNNNSLSLFDVEINTPKGFKTIIEGELIERKDDNDRVLTHWKSEGPLDGINLVAGRYDVKETNYNNIRIQTYLFPQDGSLSAEYLEWSKGYIKLYEGIFGAYPYKKFAVVENILPTGYGMPSFTLLGRDVIRLPFIVSTSLGHEIAHNWWGNSVFLNPAQGNWLEALTTYTADHLQKEKMGEEFAARYRKDNLIKYTSILKGDGIPLRKFTEPVNTRHRLVGYNKGMMVFHMLRKIIGDENFYKALRDFYKEKVFKRASWMDLKKYFEKEYGKDLTWFFDQWLSRRGGPRIHINNTAIETLNGRFSLHFDLKQGRERYRLEIPLRIETKNGTINKLVSMSSVRKNIVITLDSMPLSIEIDPEYDIFRILDDAEIPPNIDSLLSGKGTSLVLPFASLEPYEGLGRFFNKEYGFKVKRDMLINGNEFNKHNLIIAGGNGENKIFDKIKVFLPKEIVFMDKGVKISGKFYSLKEKILITTLKAGNHTHAVIAGSIPSADAIIVANKLSHYGKYGFLLFDKDGRLITKGQFESGKKYPITTP